MRASAVNSKGWRDAKEGKRAPEGADPGVFDSIYCNSDGTRLADVRVMINTNQIKPNTPVFCSKNVQFGVVDHMEGTDCIKLNKDKSGQHHYIPLSWVLSVDGKVHLDRPGEQAMREWTTSPSNAKAGASEKTKNENSRA